MEEKKMNLSRRRFVTTTLAGVGAGVLAGTMGTKVLEAEAVELSSLPPWPYQKLHSQAVAKKASDLFLSKAEYEALKSGTAGFTGMCCNEAALQAIVKSSGYSLPAGITSAFGGGVAGWGCLCGAITGALCGVGCFHGKITRDTQGSGKAFPIAQRLMDWMTKTAGAPCCHVSVSTRSRNEGWFGQKWGSPDHYRSCALWTGRVVEYTVKLLNADADGKFTAYKPPDYTKGCATCHNPMSGVSDCFACHDEKSYSGAKGEKWPAADPHKHGAVPDSIRNPKQPNYLKRENGYLSAK